VSGTKRSVNVGYTFVVHRIRFTSWLFGVCFQSCFTSW